MRVRVNPIRSPDGSQLGQRSSFRLRRSSLDRGKVPTRVTRSSSIGGEPSSTALALQFFQRMNATSDPSGE